MLAPACTLGSLADTGLAVFFPHELGPKYERQVFSRDPHGLGDTPKVSTVRVYKSGNVTSRTAVTPSDIITLINCVFKAPAMIVPGCAGKVNRDGAVNSTDIIHLINFVFKGGAPPLAGCE
jgi:hypothetical protein